VIVNAFSVVAAFAAVLRIALGALVVVIAVRALRRPADEARFHLLVVLAATLLGLGVASWPLYYLVLQSYVLEWPGVMCIQGVTQIGNASVGLPAQLPRLVAALELLKPAVVFVAGVWLVLHLVHRARRTGALAGRVLVALLAFGLLASLDGSAEAAYLWIPKKENVLATGCCSPGPTAAVFASTGPAAFAAPEAEDAPSLVPFFALAAVVVLLSTAALRRLRSGAGTGAWLPLSLLAAAASLPVGAAFLVTTAAPAFLRLPYHECGYCLIASAPESLAGIALFCAGAFAVGWACVARWLGGAGRALCVPLLSVARFGYAGALVMSAVRLALP